MLMAEVLVTGVTIGGDMCCSCLVINKKKMSSFYAFS